MVVLTFAETYYVTPSSNTPCPEDDVPCFTLSQYATKPSNFFASNTTLILLPENHSLDLEFSIWNITFLSVETSHSDTSITCNQSARLTFENITVVSIRGLALFGCVNNKVTSVERFSLEDCSLQGQGRNGTGLELNEVSTANITRSSFSSNTGREILLVGLGYGNQVGGAIIVINSRVSVTISNCAINNNTVTDLGGAVYIYSSPAIIVNSTLNSNSVTGDGGYGGAVYADSSPITIDNCTFNNNVMTSDFGRGGAVYIVSSLAPNIISNSTLNGNTVTGYRGAGGTVFAAYSRTTIEGSALNNNTVTGDDGWGGALCTYASLITIINSTLNNNTVTGYGAWGGAVGADSSNFTIVNSSLNSNTVTGDGHGGAVYALSSPITLDKSTLMNNLATGYGGAVYAETSPITIDDSTLNNNIVIGSGGVVAAFGSPVTIVNSTLNNNTAIGDYGGGGAAFAIASPIAINSSSLNSNAVTGVGGGGGAVFAQLSPITINNITLKNNTVTGDGGAVFALSSTITIDSCVFTDNTVTGTGSAFYLISVTLNSSGFLDIQNNMASLGVLYAVESTLLVSGKTTVMNNYGSLFVYSCNVTFMGYTSIMNNSLLSNSSQEGGAVTSFQSEIFFMGRANLMYNRAIRGGAISATQSKLFMYGDITVSYNTALISGGGIYAYQSELNFKKNINFSRNSVNCRGGGIHVISSTTRLTDGSKTCIVANHAKRGGGMCLESGAKIYLLKNNAECMSMSLRRSHYLCKLRKGGDANLGLKFVESAWTTLHLYNNTADYGGAMYVADDTNSATCYANPFSDKTTISGECFFQNLALYKYPAKIINETYDLVINLLNTNFAHNSAAVAGDVIYGGLLDRCGVSPIAEIFQNYANLTSSSLSTISYIIKVTDLERENFKSTKLISSDPVGVCFCRDNQPDCSYHPFPIHVKKGETFTVSLVAVDHINNTIANSTIHAYVSLEAKLGEGQSLQQTSGDDSCTDLTYSILSPNNSEKLHLYADGPCMSAGMSTANLTVNIAPCPIGFIDTGLRCECDPKLNPEYIFNCSIDRETVQRKDNVWFAYVNTTDHRGYILHKHCPFDYCHQPTKNISVNLNIENGANELCAFNRSGKLCGSCKDSLSLSLGSSRCRPCSNKWLTVFIVFAIAGVALVAFLLKLNFTVAVGTSNGLIFYANIFAANRAIFFPSDETKIMTVFIAWLNLDFGFETCFYDGMDGYAKTWLQLAFPLYVISLVVAIIIISEYSTKFAALFTGKNPIATLATLVLLSYTKLLRTIIASLSFTELQYSDGSHEVVWLVDANIPYLSRKHIPLFITALVIVIVGITYTFILFAWQWLVYCPNRGPLRWIIGSTKVIAFMDAYHNPYNKDHRYWIGLLLLVRVVLYLVSSVNVLGDPRINLLSITSAVVILFVLQRVIESKRKLHKKNRLISNNEMFETVSKIHKNSFTEILETISFLNFVGLTIATFFITENKDSQNVVAYISTGIAFITFLVILVYHVYQFVLKRPFQKISTNLHIKREPESQILVATSPVNQSVSESEIVVPELLDIISMTEEEQFVTTEDIGIEPAEVHTGPDTHGSFRKSSQPLEVDIQPPTKINNEIPRVQAKLVYLNSHAKPVNDRFIRFIHRKESSSSLTSRNPPSHIPAPCNENSPAEIELPNLASGHELATVNLFQQSGKIEASLEDDYNRDQSFEEEKSPLLPRD